MGLARRASSSAAGRSTSTRRSTVADGETARAPRPQRRRQVHARRRARRAALAARRRHDRRSTASASIARPPERRHDRRRASRTTCSSRSSRRSRTWRSRCGPAGVAQARRAPRGAHAAPRAASRPTSTRRRDRAPSPAASGSGSRSRARCVAEPRLLLLDEPLAAVDVAARAELRAPCARSSPRSTAPACSSRTTRSTRSRSPTASRSSRRGTITQTGTPDEIRPRTAQSRYAADLVGMNLFAGTLEPLEDGAGLLRTGDGAITVVARGRASRRGDRASPRSTPSTWRCICGRPRARRATSFEGAIAEVAIDGDAGARPHRTAPRRSSAEVTRGSVERLGLREGGRVWAVLQSGRGPLRVERAMPEPATTGYPWTGEDRRPRGARGRRAPEPDAREAPQPGPAVPGRAARAASSWRWSWPLLIKTFLVQAFFIPSRLDGADARAGRPRPRLEDPVLLRRPRAAATSSCSRTPTRQRRARPRRRRRALPLAVRGISACSSPTARTTSSG